MSRTEPSPKRPARSLARREALKGLGALVITAPSLAALGCSDSERMNEPSASAGGGGEPMPATAGGQATAAAPPTPAGAGGRVGPAMAPPPAPGGAAGASTSPGAGGSAAGSNSAPRASAGTGGASGTGASAAGTSAAGASGANASAASGGSASPAPSAGDFIPVTFADAASCMLTPTDPAGEGPFFIHEDEVMNDTNLLRSDMRENKPGVELQLNLRLLDSDGKCMTPIAGVEVYTWHTDALGFYSGFADQNPDQAYMGAGERTVENMDRFCRGMLISGEDGVVRFKTVYPGWYNGRAIHIHFLALRPGSGAGTMSYRSKQYMVFTTQMYFAESFSRMIHENNDPYKQRASGTAYSMWVKPQNMTVNPSVRMEGKIAVGALNIVTSAMGSRR